MLSVYLLAQIQIHILMRKKTLVASINTSVAMILLVYYLVCRKSPYNMKNLIKNSSYIFASFGIFMQSFQFILFLSASVLFNARIKVQSHLRIATLREVKRMSVVGADCLMRTLSAAALEILLVLCVLFAARVERGRQKRHLL